MEHKQDPHMVNNAAEIKLMQTDLHEMKAQMKEMYQALIGNTVLNDGGLVGRVNKQQGCIDKLEDRVDKLEEKNHTTELYQKIMFAALGAVAMAVFSYVLQFLFKK